jgi:hypothetical protein
MENPNQQVITQQEFAAKFRSKQEVSAPAAGAAPNFIRPQ